MRIHFRIRIAFAKLLKVIALHRSIALSHFRIRIANLRFCNYASLSYAKFSETLYFRTILLKSLQSCSVLMNSNSTTAVEFLEKLQNFANWELGNYFYAM